jgi:solute carrier family 25 citrate transporter 1
MDDDGGRSVSSSSSAMADGARGALAGVSSRFVTHPLDTLKARAQVRGATTSSNAMMGVRSTSGIGSFGRLYAGFGAVAAFAPVASGAYFVGYESGRARLGEGALASAATGMWAQALAGVVYTPMDVIKERLQTQDVLGARQRVATYRNWMDAARVIAREEGARGLFRGYWAQNFVWCPWSATYFVLYERSRGAFAAVSGDSDDDEAAAVSPTASSACATFAASAATTLTHPLDLAKTRLQTMRFESSSLVHVLSDVIRREGFKGVFAGVGARVAAVAPGSAISFFVYESLKKSGW